MTSEAQNRPRVGVPYRTQNEELTNKRGAYDTYLRAVSDAGGEPVEISLSLSEGELDRLSSSLDAVLLPGSPVDVDPAIYRAARRPQSVTPDPQRERTDYTLLDRAFSEAKPVLAICYGIQILNVYLGGTLIQDIASEIDTPIKHSWRERERGTPEPFHSACFEADSRIAKLAGTVEASVNSSHHQAIRNAGRGLRVVGRASDGVVEAVEWTGGANWVTGVQWHPERIPEDPLTRALFRELLAAARSAVIRG